MSFAGGFLGVEVFLALTGFFVTMQVLDRDVDPVVFLRSRGRRLMPALVATALAGGLVMALVPEARGTLPPPIAALVTVLGVSNLVMVFQSGAMGALAHMWSIAAQLQFYVVWSVVGRRLRRSAPAAVLLVLAGGYVAMSLARIGVSLLTDGDFHVVYFQPLFRSDGFLLGAFTAVAYRQRLLSVAQVTAGALLAVAVLALLPLVADLHESWVYWYGLTVVSASTCWLIAHCLQVPASPIARLLSLRPLRYVGTLSYSLYLIHLPTAAVVARVIGHRHGRVALAIHAVAILGATLVLHHGLDRNRLVSLTRRARAGAGRAHQDARQA